MHVNYTSQFVFGIITATTQAIVNHGQASTNRNGIETHTSKAPETNSPSSMTLESKTSPTEPTYSNSPTTNAATTKGPIGN